MADASAAPQRCGHLSTLTWSIRSSPGGRRSLDDSGLLRRSSRWSQRGGGDQLVATGYAPKTCGGCTNWGTAGGRRFRHRYSSLSSPSSGSLSMKSDDKPFVLGGHRPGRPGDRPRVSWPVPPLRAGRRSPRRGELADAVPAGRSSATSARFLFSPPAVLRPAGGVVRRADRTEPTRSSGEVLRLAR